MNWVRACVICALQEELRSTVTRTNGRGKGVRKVAMMVGDAAGSRRRNPEKKEYGRTQCQRLMRKFQRALLRPKILYTLPI